MDLQTHLIESKKQKRQGLGASTFSIGFHGILIAAIIYSGLTASNKIDAEERMIKAFITQGAAPPPPPPPPPPPAATSAPKATPKVQPKIEPKPITQNVLIAPTEIPKEIPKVEIPTTVDLKPSEGSAPVGGVVGGVPGGVVGGVVGGVKGGVIGGELGGVLGGELGGVKGGQLGGTGTGTEGAGEKEAPPTGPVRVGGDVKAPKALERVEPEYTDIARQARITGVVVVEAIIDRNGNVDQVRILKGLPMGLGEAAERAVRKWKFRPGTLNGQPVDVIFNLTVTFKLD